MSTTRTVSIRAFRENMTKFLKEGQKKNIHFVIMRHSEPVARVSPVKRDAALESIARDVAIAREEYKEGKTFTTQELRGMLDL